LEVWCIWQMQTRQEFSPIERDRVRMPALGRECIQGARIAPEYVRVDAHFLGAACNYHGLTDGPSQMVQRFAERGAGVRVIELWPEQGHERVAPVKGSASIDSQERQEGEAFWLRRGIRLPCGRIGDQI
jgi:hypothetical protein